jgi:hypothetical protein
MNRLVDAIWAIELAQGDGGVGEPLTLLKEVQRINARQRERFVKRVRDTVAHEQSSSDRSPA